MKIATLELEKTELIKSFEVIIKLRPDVPLTNDEFFDFCQANNNKQIEQTKDGEIIIMPPTGWSTGRKNLSIGARLFVWTEKDGRGEAADSNAGYVLPNGAIRSPDASWVLRERIEKLNESQLDKFLPLCPDFVVELTSPSDSLKDVQERMREYIENGAQLGWLIHSKSKQVFVYRPQQEVEVLENPEKVTGEPLLSGFELELGEIW